MTSIDLLTVTYSRDLPLLRLQAASIERFVDKELINEIHVINNDDMDLSYLPELYGSLANKVKISRYSDYHPRFDRHPERRYTSQMFLKCAYAKRSTDHYLILDSKNIFIKQIDRAVLFPNGKPIMSKFDARSFLRRPFERDMWEGCRFLGTKEDLPLQYYTPFLASREVMLSMMRKIGMDFHDWIMHRNHESSEPCVYEFFLYSAAMERYEDHHEIVPRFANSVWPNAKITPNMLEGFIATGIHASAYSTLDLDAWAAEIERLGIMSQDSFRQIHADML